MTRGLFTSTEEIKFQKVYKAPLLGTKRTEKFKPLFTSIEEIRFHSLMRGEIVPCPVKRSQMTRGEIRQGNRRVAQNLRRINQNKIQVVWRER